MTVVTMIAGMIPLIIAGGAGANGNRVLALGVTAGMAVGTLALVFVVPAFFIVFQKLHEKVYGVPAAVAEAEATVEVNVENEADTEPVVEKIVFLEDDHQTEEVADLEENNENEPEK